MKNENQKIPLESRYLISEILLVCWFCLITLTMNTSNDQEFGIYFSMGFAFGVGYLINHYKFCKKIGELNASRN